MGFNKVVLMLNDAQDAIDEDPKGWWEACKYAFMRLGMKPRNARYVQPPETFGFHGFCNYWQAVWEAHADNTAVILVGENSATVLGSSLHGHATEEKQIQTLKDVLGRMGYNVVKKRK